MIRSMTGYGRAVETVAGPRLYRGDPLGEQPLPGLRRQAARVLQLRRGPGEKAPQGRRYPGKVDAFVTVTALTAEPMQISLNRPVLEGYLAALRQVSGDYDVKDDISVSTLARFSDIFLVEKADSDEAALTAALLGVVDTGPAGV